MIPVNQFILGGSDPLLYPSEKMTNSIDEQIAFLQSQKQAINEAYRRNAIPNANNGVTQNQQVTHSFDKFLKPIADKDGMIDIEGIFDEEMEIINNIDNFDFDIPFIGGGNISKGIISLEIPYVNKIVALNQTDLEVLKVLLHFGLKM